MRILISIITTIFSHKIKMKIDKALIKTLIRTLNEILNKSHMILDSFLNEIEVDQKIIFSSKNMIITEKIIFILIAAIQIIQFITANTHLTQIEYLQKMIKQSHSLLKHD